MNSSAVLKVGLFVYAGVTPRCALNLTRLVPTKMCPDIGVSLDLFGKALELARIPYRLVPFDKADNEIGVLNETTAIWTGG